MSHKTFLLACNNLVDTYVFWSYVNVLYMSWLWEIKLFLLTNDM